VLTRWQAAGGQVEPIASGPGREPLFPPPPQQQTQRLAQCASGRGKSRFLRAAAMRIRNEAHN